MKRALIIDDEPLIRQALKKLLIRNQLNIEVIGEASNGMEALAWFEREKPDLIFLDIRMPLMDGFGLLKKLNEQHVAVKTIILTAYRDFDYAAEAIGYGAFGYLVKPIDERKFIEMVAKAELKIDEEQQAESARRQLKDIQRTSYFESLLDGNSPLTFHGQNDFHPELANKNCQLVIVRSPVPVLADAVEYHVKKLGPSVVFSYKGDLVFVYNHDADADDPIIMANLTESLIDMQNRLGNEQGVFVFGASAPFARLENLRHAYQQARAAIFYRNVTSVPHVYLYTNEQNPIAYDPDSIANQALFEQFSEKLGLGLLDEAWALIHLFTEQISSANHMDIDLVYHLYYKFVIDIKQHISRFNRLDQYKSMLAEFKFADLQKYQTLLSISDFFAELSYSFIDLPIVEDSHRMVQKIKKFIQENYAKEISLHSLSEQLYLSKNYISAVFKQKTGENFMDYLTCIRMEQAKNRLATTEKGIHQIAEEVGYKNTSHFGKVFKQEIGVTPAEYRQRISQVNDF